MIINIRSAPKFLNINYGTSNKYRQKQTKSQLSAEAANFLMKLRRNIYNGEIIKGAFEVNKT